MKNLYVYLSDVYSRAKSNKPNKYRLLHSSAMMIASKRFTIDTIHQYCNDVSSDIKSVNIRIKNIRHIILDDIDKYPAYDEDIEKIIKYAQLCNSIDYKYNIRKARK